MTLCKDPTIGCFRHDYNLPTQSDHGNTRSPSPIHWLSPIISYQPDSVVFVPRQCTAFCMQGPHIIGPHTAVRIQVISYHSGRVCIAIGFGYGIHPAHASGLLAARLQLLLVRWRPSPTLGTWTGGGRPRTVIGEAVVWPNYVFSDDLVVQMKMTAHSGSNFNLIKK